MPLEHESDSVIARAVRAAGSQSAFARLVSRPDKKVGQSTVSGWLKAGRVSYSFVLTVEAATGISRHDLRPDLYPRDPAPADAARTRFARRHRLEPAR